LARSDRLDRGRRTSPDDEALAVQHDDLGAGFRDVDGASPAHLASWLDVLSAHPDFRKSKSETVAALELGSGMSALDIGCGLGDEARAMAHLVSPGGTAIGLDASSALVDAARARTSEQALPALSLMVADAHALPLNDKSMDAVRIERTLQHVENPVSVVREAARVLRPGGRLVVWEPDWDTLVVAGEPASVGRVVTGRRAAAFRNPTIGRDLPRLALLAGLEITRVEAARHLVREPRLGEAQFSLENEARAAVTEGVLDEHHSTEWIADLERRSLEGSYLVALGAILLVAEAPA
jgi:SAM-dependent methyltransferase